MQDKKKDGHVETQLKRVFNDMGGMYESMARKMGNLVRCGTCGIERSVDPVKCLQSGWPKCCGYTMTLL